MTWISLSDLPKGSKLILIGDWYRKLDGVWYAVCYFLDANNTPFRKGLPVDLLPALTPGTVFPRTSVGDEVKGYTGTFKAPSMNEWQKLRYEQLPESLKRLRKYSDEVKNQLVYRLDAGQRVIWLPATELARMLYFHSAEVVRAAVYQGNTWQLAKSDHQDWVGEVIFSSNVPVNYLNSLLYRKFFAWLLFDDDAENSFCSIFNHINLMSFIDKGHERLTFDIQPPDLSSCEISWVGYTGSEDKGEKHHCYVREVRSISGIPSPPLETIFFSHPDDLIVVERGNKDNKDEGNRLNRNDSKVEPKEIDPNNPPRGGKRRHLLRLNPTGLHFDIEPDLRRSPRHIMALPRGDMPNLDELQEENIVGVTEGSDQGTNPRVDVDSLEEPDLIAAPEKIAFFQAMVDLLKTTHGWKIETQTDVVPRNRCRSAHLVDGRPRQYCHALLKRDSDSVVHMLEIELTKSESLSTLFFRVDDDKLAVEKILDALMTSNSHNGYKAMQWKRKINSEQTKAHYYLDHPENKIKSEEEALESWVARAAEKIMRL